MPDDINEGVTTEQVADAHEENVAEESQYDDEGKIPATVNVGRVREKYEGQIAEKDKTIAALTAQLNQNQNQQVVNQNQIEEEDFLADKDDNDVPTYGDLKKERARLKREQSKLESQIKRASIIEKTPNYVEIIRKYEHEVPTAIANAIHKSGDLEAAIEACKNTPGYIRDMADDNMHPDARKALENAKKPKSPSSLASTGAVSKNSKYLQMTRAERRSMQEKFCRG